MKNLITKTENDQMSISVDGVPLKIDHEGHFIITKEMMTGMNLLHRNEND